MIVLSSSSEWAAELLVSLGEDEGFRAGAEGLAFLESLAAMCGARAQDAEIRRVVPALAALPSRNQQRRLALALGEGLRRSGSYLDVGRFPPGPARDFLAGLWAEARRIAADREGEPAGREQAIRLLACAPPAQAADALTALPNLCMQVFIVLGCLIYLWSLSWRTLLAVIAFLVVGVVTYQLPMRLALRHFSAGRESMAKGRCRYTAFLPKPFNMTILLKTVMQVITRAA